MQHQGLLSGTLTSHIDKVRLSATEFVADIGASRTQETLCFPTRRIMKATLDGCELLTTVDTVTSATGHGVGQLVICFDNKSDTDSIELTPLSSSL